MPAVGDRGLRGIISEHEDTERALLGTATETILPVGGMLLMYGDGGAGKTTLTIRGGAPRRRHAVARHPCIEDAVSSLVIGERGPAWSSASACPTSTPRGTATRRSTRGCTFGTSRGQVQSARGGPPLRPWPPP